MVKCVLLLMFNSLTESAHVRINVQLPAAVGRAERVVSMVSIVSIVHSTLQTRQRTVNYYCSGTQRVGTWRPAALHDQQRQNSMADPCAPSHRTARIVGVLIPNVKSARSKLFSIVTSCKFIQNTSIDHQHSTRSLNHGLHRC